MSYVIDRRLNGKNKSTVNRQRFLQRYRGHIKKAVEEAVGRRSITDMEHGEQISIPGRDIDEPVLHHGRGGRQTIVHPGNKEFVAGERIPRPQGGGGGQGAGGPATAAKAWMTSSFRSPRRNFSTSCSRTRSCPTGQASPYRHGHLQDGTRWHRERRQPVAHQHRSHPAFGPCTPHCAIGQQPCPAQGAEGRAGTAAPGGAAQFRRHQGCRRRDRTAQGAHQPRAISGHLRSQVQPAGQASQPQLEGGDVLPDGRFRLDDPVHQGHRQALLHPVVPVPQAELRQDRRGVHSPPHQCQGSGRGRVLLLTRNRRHHRFQRAEDDAGDHGRALSGQQVEHLRRASFRRRQLERRFAAVPRYPDQPDHAVRAVLHLRRNHPREHRALWYEYNQSPKPFPMRSPNSNW